MNIKNIELNKNKTGVIIEVEFSGEIWDKEYNQIKNKKIKELKIPGFRPGKAPQHEIDKRITPIQIANETVFAVYEKEAENIFKEVKAKHDNVFPRFGIEEFVALTAESAIVKFSIPLLPDMKKIKISDVKVEMKKLTVSDKEIEEQIKSMLQKNALLLPLKATDKTKSGDVVVLNYKGYVNNEPFDGGEAQNYELKLGSKTFIDTFEEQLMDKKIGWKGEVKVRFPEKYAVDTLKGQEAIFECEIIDAKRLEEVEINDDAIKALQIPNVETVKQAKSDIKERIILSKSAEIDFSTFNDVVTKLQEKNKYQIEDIIVEAEVEKRFKELNAQLKQQGLKMDDYLQLIKKTEQDFKKLIAEEEKTKLIDALISEQLFNNFKEKNKDEKATENEEKYAMLILSSSSNLPLPFAVEFFEQKSEETKKYLEGALLQAKFLLNLTEQINKEIADSNHKTFFSSLDKQIKTIKEEKKKLEQEAAKKANKEEKTEAEETTKESATKAKKTTSETKTTSTKKTTKTK